MSSNKANLYRLQNPHVSRDKPKKRPYLVDIYGYKSGRTITVWAISDEIAMSDANDHCGSEENVTSITQNGRKVFSLWG